MKLKKTLAALLALMMLLSLAACGGEKTPANSEKQDPTAAASPDASPSAGEEDTEPKMSEEEKAAFYQEKLADYTQRIAGLNPDDVVLTINDHDITAELYLYWLTYNCMYWDSMSRAMYGNELDFDEVGSNGLTYREYLKDDAVQLLLSYEVMMQHAEEEGCAELTQEQQEQWERNVAQHIGNYGDADMYYMYAQSGMNEDLFKSIQTVSAIYDNLCFALNGDPTQEEMDMYIKQKDLLHAKHILICTAKDGEDGTIVRNSNGTVINDADGNPYKGGAEQYNAEALAKANDLYAQLQSASDPHALFDELMLIHSEDPGSKSQPEGYDFSAGQMVQEFEEGTRALKYGEIGAPVESKIGYHIILRTRPDVKDAYLEEVMNLYLDNWMFHAKVDYTDLYAQLDAQKIYEEYVAYQDELRAVRNG